MVDSIGKTDEHLAQDVGYAVNRLNEAVNAAADAGLDIEIDTLPQRTPKGERPMLKAMVFRPISTSRRR